MNTILKLFIASFLCFFYINAKNPAVKYPYKFKAKGNPIITHIYTADPSARVFDGRLYVYPSHDMDTATWFNMEDWHVFSTADMKNWTDHGVCLSLKDLNWAQKYAWAPDCVYKNGKYYFYYPTDKSLIGVAVGDKPYGPFVDPIKKPLVTPNTPGVVAKKDMIDPCVFIDDDGSAYLYFGQDDVNMVRLDDDMISFSDTVKILKGTNHFFEAIWMHKFNGKYYLSYSGNGRILYCMSNSPYGPFEYKGEILQPMNSCTNHHSIVEFKGQWYLFYHNSDLFFGRNKHLNPVCKWPEISCFRRSICVDKLSYNADGTIKKVIY
jgi:arabinoxylan arabinofuranohydrolase